MDQTTIKHTDPLRAKSLLLESAWLSCPVQGRLLGVDHGRKTLGLALSDVGQGMATPLKTIKRGKVLADLQALKQVIEGYEVVGLVVGYPLHMNGDEGARAQSVRDYMGHVRAALPDLWLGFWDERLSSAGADTYLRENTNMNASKRAAHIDAVAAQIILEGALAFLVERRRSAEAGSR